MSYRSMMHTILTLCLCPLALTLSSPVYHDYCVIGAGPSGLQLGHFLQKAGRNYILFEKSNQSGNFFEHYPRHRKLISINKRHTGKINAEFNMRHDWNSLLSDDDTLRVTKYSKDMFPHADVLLKYLKDYQERLSIRVQFNTEMSNIRTLPNTTAPDGHLFLMDDQNGQTYTCRAVVVATGMATPRIPKMKGIEHARGYEDVSIDPNHYEGKTVLILGRGNSAFEVADGIYGSTNLIHMIGRSRIRLAWATHYVGDLRAVNNGLLDTYQLKSLDGLSEGFLTNIELSKHGEKFLVGPYYENSTGNNDFSTSEFFDDSIEPYDVVIRACGFTFDSNIFQNSDITRGRRGTKKFPLIHHNYESYDHLGLFYSGTVTHSLDFKKSAGAFIHGFRYTTRALHRLLEWRYEGVPWPYISIPTTQLINTIIKRINEASGMYQMFSVIGDVVLYSEDGQTVEYLEDFPIKLLHELERHTGHTAKAVLVICMEYGANFSGPGKDVFNENRAFPFPYFAHKSNFLHPVMYYYKNLPSEEQMKNETVAALPRPDYLHHIAENFLTRWTAQSAHIQPFRRFLENIQDTDYRHFFPETCFQLAMTEMSIPLHCQQQYLKGM